MYNYILNTLLNLKLAQKIFWAILMAALVPVVVISFVAHKLIVSQALDTFQQATLGQLSLIEKSTRNLFDADKRVLDLIASDTLMDKVSPSLSGQLSAQEAQSLVIEHTDIIGKNLKQLLDQIKKSQPAYEDCYLGTKWGGFIISGNSKLPPGYDPRKRPWYIEAVEAPTPYHISDAYASTTGALDITVTRKVERNGELMGILAIDLTLGQLSEIIKESKLGAGGFISVMQDDSTVLVNPIDSSLVFKKASSQEGAYLLPSIGNPGDRFLVRIGEKSYFSIAIESKELGWTFVGFVPEAEFLDAAKATVSRVLIVGFILVMLLAFVSVFVVRILSRPIVQTSQMMLELSQGKGDLTQTLSIHSHDEIGELAERFNQFLENLREIISQIQQQFGSLRKNSSQLNTVSDVVFQTVADSNMMTKSVAASTEEMAITMRSLSQLVDATNHSMLQVSNSVSQMTASISEIARNSEQTRQISAKAVEATLRTTERVNSLIAASNEIGNVVDMIQSIAKQTNLLALNATIEAATAGEAGKGFAVVASEVKELARNTSIATEDIRKRVMEIKDSTQLTVDDISGIREIISEVDQVVSGIAAAVEEQSQTTSHIADQIKRVSLESRTASENVSEALKVSLQVSGDLSKVEQSSMKMQETIQLVRQASMELESSSDLMERHVGKFKTK